MNSNGLYKKYALKMPRLLANTISKVRDVSNVAKTIFKPNILLMNLDKHFNARRALKTKNVEQQFA
jgi:hypothetical protein